MSDNPKEPTAEPGPCGCERFQESLYGATFTHLPGCKNAPKPKEPTAEPPTLAALRKLAERKGQVLVISEYSIKVCEERTWWLQVVFGPLNILTGGTLVRSGPQARVCVFAALSALPDKPKGNR